MQRSPDIYNELREISEVVANLPGSHPFEAPGAYFDRLPDQVLARIKDQQPAGLPTEKLADPFSVPNGYFEQLSSDILNRIQTESASPSEEIEKLSPVLSKLGKTLTFTVTDDYFTEMPSNVVAGVQSLDFEHSDVEIMS